MRSGGRRRTRPRAVSITCNSTCWDSGRVPMSRPNRHCLRRTRGISAAARTRTDDKFAPNRLRQCNRSFAKRSKRWEQGVMRGSDPRLRWRRVNRQSRQRAEGTAPTSKRQILSFRGRTSRGSVGPTGPTNGRGGYKSPFSTAGRESNLDRKATSRISDRAPGS